MIFKKPDKSVKLQIYRKPTHTNQCSSFNLHHPIAHKLGVVHTLFDRCCDIVTETTDQESEIKHVEEALTRCGFPRWTFRKVKDQIQHEQNTTKTKKQKESSVKSKTMVVIPYIKGVAEKTAMSVQETQNRNISKATTNHM